MRKLLLLLALTTPVWGQGTISSLQCIKRDRAVMMRWIETPALSNDSVRCKYDYDTVSLDRQNRQMAAFATNSGRRSCAIYDLTPDDDVYLGPQVSDSSDTLWSPLLTCTGVCTNCTDSDASFFLAGGSGCDCGAAGEYPKVHTDAEVAVTAPTAPTSGALTTPPTVTGNTYTVAADCSDFETQKNNAEADAATVANRVSELLVPAQGAAGAVKCELANTTTFQLEPIANNGTVYMHSNVDAKLLPPAGTQLDKTYLPFLAAFTWADGGLQSGDGYHPFFEAQANARGYYIRHIEIRPPNWKTHTPIDMTITGIDPATDIITVSASVPATIVGGMTVVVDLTGTGIRGAQGVAQICAISGATFKLSSGMTAVTNGAGCGTVFNLLGTYGSGGTVRRMVAAPIASHGTSGGLHTITVTGGHKMGQFPDMTITGATASTLTVTGTPSEYNISQSVQGPHASVVHVEGTSDAGCDGLWAVTISGSTLTLNRTGFTPDCGGVTTGTVHGHKAISIWKTSNDVIGDHEPRSHNWEVIDANTLQLLEVTAEAGVTGGYLFWDLEDSGRVINTDLDDSTPMTDVTFDQVYVNWCLPYRTMSGINLARSEDSTVINSIAETCNYIRANPVDSTASPDGRLERIHGNSQGGGGITPGDTNGVVLQNNYFNTATVFADDSSGGVKTAVTDFQLRQNYFWRPDWMTISTSSYRRHWFRAAFPMELKSAGPRHAVTGNYVKGWISDFAQAAYAFAYANNGSRSAIPNGVTDLAMEYNIFATGGGSIFGMTTANDGTYGAEKLFNLTERLRFAGNLAVKLDTVTYKTGLAGAATGTLVNVTSGYRDFVIENNTWVPERTNNGRAVSAANSRGSGMRVLNNIIGFTEGINTTLIGFHQDTGGTQIPAPAQVGGYAAFQEWNIRGTATDPLSEITGNIALAMLKASSVGAFATKAASADPADTHCETSLAANAKVLNLPMTWVGNANTPCDESLNTRLAELFSPGTFTAIAPYAGKGANLTTLADAQGLPSAVALTSVSPTAMTISFHAPTAAACPVDVAPWTGSWTTTWDTAGDITRQSDAAPDQEQAVPFTGLTAATEYAYRGHCKRGFIGRFKTAG